MSKLIKILTVVPGSEDPNSMIFAKNQIASIAESGVSLKIFFLRSRLSPSGLIKSWKAFHKEIIDFKPDIVHAYYGTITSFFCAVTTRKPLVISFQGSDINKTPSDGWARDFMGRLLSQVSILRATSVICVSQNLKNNIWWQKRKVLVIPNGINAKLFRPTPKEEARRLLNWGMEETVILFNANNPKIKRLDLAELVIIEVRRQIPLTRLNILNGKIPPEKISLYLNACDCVLLCSDSEGSPMIIKEALACNTPIVTVDVGDVKERINSVNGTSIVNQNSSDLAKAIIEIVLKGTRTNGREKIFADGLTEENIANRIISIYNTVLGIA